VKIHQILINDSGKLLKQLPGYAEMCVKSITDFYGTEEYHLYSGEEIEEIIKSNFDVDVYKSYQKLKPYAYKADLARYCLLYLYGGLYIDLNTKFINRLDEKFLNQWDLFAFRDCIGSSVRNWAVMNSIIFSKPKVKVLQQVIQIVVENCKNEIYGIQAIVPSGCMPFGKAINSAKQDELICINGEILCLNSQMNYAPKKVWGFFTDYGDFIALRKPPEADIGDMKIMGFPQTNNYVQMWKNKDVYDTSIKIC
jgi:hypothetical protein